MKLILKALFAIITGGLGSVLGAIILASMKDISFASSITITWKWAVIAVVLVMAILIIRRFPQRASGEGQFMPSRPSFKSLALRGLRWEWEWGWDTNASDWYVEGLRIRCPKCTQLMIYTPIRSIMHGASADCPYCGHFINNALDRKLPELQEVMTVIRDKVKEERNINSGKPLIS